jgi:hypothetical protein
MDISGFLQLLELYAQVAGGSACLLAEEDEVGLLHRQEQGHHRQTQL